MMSLDAKGKFMARCGIDTTTSKVFKDGLPKRTLYNMCASTARN